MHIVATVMHVCSDSALSLYAQFTPLLSNAAHLQAAKPAAFGSSTVTQQLCCNRGKVQCLTAEHLVDSAWCASAVCLPTAGTGPCQHPPGGVVTHACLCQVPGCAGLTGLQGVTQVSNLTPGVPMSVGKYTSTMRFVPATGHVQQQSSQPLQQSNCCCLVHAGRWARC